MSNGTFRAVSTLTGEVRNLTNTPEISEESPRWSPDGKRLAYTWKPKTAPSYEIHVMEFATGRVTQITKDTPKEFSNEDPVWSPDGRSLAFTRTRADEKADALFVATLRISLRRVTRRLMTTTTAD